MLFDQLGVFVSRPDRFWGLEQAILSLLETDEEVVSQAETDFFAF
jgi:hypothetical protein